MPRSEVRFLALASRRRPRRSPATAARPRSLRARQAPVHDPPFEQGYRSVSGGDAEGRCVVACACAGMARPTEMRLARPAAPRADCAAALAVVVAALRFCVSQAIPVVALDSDAPAPNRPLLHPPALTEYIGSFEIVDDHRSGKIVVSLLGRINKCVESGQWACQGPVQPPPVSFAALCRTSGGSTSRISGSNATPTRTYILATRTVFTTRAGGRGLGLL